MRNSARIWIECDISGISRHSLLRIQNIQNSELWPLPGFSTWHTSMSWANYRFLALFFVQFHKFSHPLLHERIIIGGSKSWWFGNFNAKLRRLSEAIHMICICSFSRFFRKNFSPLSGASFFALAFKGFELHEIIIDTLAPTPKNVRRSSSFSLLSLLC